MVQRAERLYLVEILNAIDRALKYTAEGRDAFLGDPKLGDPKTQDAVIRNIEIIGEAVRGISEATRRAPPEVPWSKIAGTRDRVIHGYFNVDLEIIWEIVEAELPGLRQQRSYSGSSPWMRIETRRSTVTALPVARPWTRRMKSVVTPWMRRLTSASTPTPV